MQYHNMLKQKHEMEQKAASDAAAKKKALEDKAKAGPAKTKEQLAEEAAEELLKAEEREKESKKAFSSGGVKKGFLEGKGKKK